ncbi:MAG: cell division FtsZ family protein [Deltaproteobacteria bacterium]|jgi:cell division protein FtsZ|nr:cell division FtsZ family protein [Deltaproteobacteria bacterium]
MENKVRQHVIKIFGLGGCGINALTHMINSGLTGAEFVAADSDLIVLNRCLAPVRIQVGVQSARGNGCGGSFEKGQKCVQENLAKILEALAGGDLIFMTAGLGRGIGGGGLGVVAKALAEQSKPPVIVAVVTTPFQSEDNRLPAAWKSLDELYRYCNSVIIVDNVKLEALDPDAAYLANLKKGNDVLFRAVSSIVNIVKTPGEINVDFADVAEVLKRKGAAIISYGEAKGPPKRASEALNNALSNPLTADASLTGAQAVICDIAADEGVLVREVMDVNQRIRKAIGSNSKLFFGLVIDNTLKETNTLRVTVLATGLPRRYGPALTENEKTPSSLMASGESTAPSELIMDVDLKPSLLNPAARSPKAPDNSLAPPVQAPPSPRATQTRLPIRPNFATLENRPRPSVPTAGFSDVNDQSELYSRAPYKRKPAD